MPYIVMCRVSGGVTGTREAPLKEHGRVKMFATFEEAANEARKLNTLPRPYSLATFKYWPQETP